MCNDDPRSKDAVNGSFSESRGWIRSAESAFHMALWREADRGFIGGELGDRRDSYDDQANPVSISQNQGRLRCCIRVCDWRETPSQGETKGIREPVFGFFAPNAVLE